MSYAPSPTLRWAVALALGLSLAACSDKKADQATPPAAAAAQQQQQAAEAVAAQQAAQQAAALAALSADELRTRGRAALREQRIYAPAGDNAMEYYLALRKKTAKPDPSAESALMDLQPYAVIAAEQAIGRKDYVEADRLRSLIAAADPQAPSLTRIADAIAKGKAAAVQEAALAQTKTADDLAAAEAAKVKAAEDAKAAAAANQAAAAAAASRPPPQPAASTPVAPPPTTASRPEPAAPTPARAEPAAPQPAPSRASAGDDLIAVSTPQPAYPPAAQRAGTKGQVVVSFTVNSDGSVANVNIVSAKPRGVFERNVQAAVKRWKFQPIAGTQQITRTFDFE
jgi:protein TonB